MKIPKDAARTARQLIRATLRDGKIDGTFAKNAVTKLATDKPRNYLAILSSYQRLLRLEVLKRHAVVESAAELSAAERNTVLSELHKKYGTDITSEFKVTPELLGGMRVKIGSSVWDGSVKARIDALKNNLGA
jgi:F-type H+-transporting ATPase subunit delta